jgi:hypothetical protein
MSTVVLAPSSPSFSLLDGHHVSGIILRPDNSGTEGGGAYDILGPTGTSLGYPTVAAQPGDTVELFGVGFGPTSPPIPPGQAFAGAAPATASIQLAINSGTVTPFVCGPFERWPLSIQFHRSSGVGTGDLALGAYVGGVQTQPGVLISIEPLSPSVTLPSSSVPGGTSLTGTVSLPAAAGGGTVGLQSSSYSVSVPDMVLIPDGQTSANFTVTTHAVASTQQATITGSYLGASKQADLTVTPMVPPPAFTLVGSTLTFQPTLQQASFRQLVLVPDLGNSYTAWIDGLTFPGGTFRLTT